MSETSFWKRRWKLIVNIVTIVALVVLIFAVRHQLEDTVNNFSKVNVWVLLLLLPIEWLNYHAQAKLYGGLFDMVGNKLSYRFLFETSLELNFVNSVFPSGGVSGISYFGMRMRSEREKITGGRATLVQLMKLALLFLSFEILLVIGLICLAFSGAVNNFVILVAGSLSTLLVVGTVGFVMIIGHERRIQATFTFFTNLLNRLILIVRKNHPETISMATARSAVDELHSNYKLIEQHWSDLKVPFWWSFVANVAEVGAVYIVYIAFGHWVNPGAVILAYSVANFAGLISVLPGGVGIYEALMTGVLVAAGVPAAISLPVTVMYRVLNMLIQLPPGYYFYHRTLHGTGDKTQAQPGI
ncbi:MAG TPA: lysylphosphatidylglycerol synthase transmembrane domain-containing protein [Candidatus Saccharimonadales bacterium]|nr:lysylphosphatidylglycerol synthase transmembrane domain-containing protein [Candidatus Saccharimonadales bacterium]